MTHKGTCRVCGKHLEFEAKGFLSYHYLTCNIAGEAVKHTGQELQATWLKEGAPR